MIIIQPTSKNSYLRVISSTEPNTNLGIISPVSGQLAIRPGLKKILQNAGTHALKQWIPGPGRHGGVPDYEHCNQFHNADETIGYLARSISALGYSLEDHRQVPDLNPKKLGVPAPIGITEVWNRILEYQGQTFSQKKGKTFTYTINGKVLNPDRTEWNIPRASFEGALHFLPLTKITPIQNLCQGPSYVFGILMDHRIRQMDW